MLHIASNSGNVLCLQQLPVATLAVKLRLLANDEHIRQFGVL